VGTKFDSEGYYDGLVGKSNLVDLMKAASSLGVDIASLQGEKYTLVYNHHHQVSRVSYQSFSIPQAESVAFTNPSSPQMLLS